MTASDVPEVARIEMTAFSTPWSEATFRSLLERSGVELWVAEWGGVSSLRMRSFGGCRMRGSWPISRFAVISAVAASVPVF
jgi:ribosomal protein S18 acetylase RimI-like enzyme